MITFKSINVYPLSKLPAKVLVKWEMFIDKTVQLQDYEFLVERDIEAQDGRPGFQHVDIDGKPLEDKFAAKDPRNLTPISRWIDGLDFRWFVDYTPHLKNLTNYSYYRVRCRNKKTQEVVDSDVVTWQGELDLVGLYVVDEHNFLLEDAIGVPSLVYQRRHDGVLCSCFDRIQQKRLVSNCKKCYGTNWLKGFYDPIDCFVDFSPNPKVSVIEQWGEVQPNETNMLLSNFPTVASGDLVREIETNRLWRVTMSTVTEKRRALMLQFARAAEVKPGDIEYSIPNDEKFTIVKVGELNTIKDKREF